MSYTTINFKSAAALKRAVKAGEKLTCFQPGLGPDLSRYTGWVSLEGPHYPQPHRWYCQANMVDGIIKAVK